MESKASTPAGTYMAPLEGLSDEGLRLIRELKEAGRLVRTLDGEMRRAGGQLARALEDELQHLKNTHATTLRELAASTTASSHLMDQVKRFVAAAEAQKAAITAKRAELEKLREAPPGAEERQRAIDVFNGILERLREECETLGERVGRRIRVPWQLEQCAAIDADDPQPVVPLEGGRILDADGNNVWGSDCESCGWEIQDGAKGEGTIRYHSLEQARTDFCEDCFTSWLMIWNNTITDESAKQTLLEKNPNLSHASFIIAEDNIDVFLRNPIVEAPSIADSVHAIFSVFANRPCIGVREKVGDCRWGDYHWFTYKQIYAQVTELSCGLKALMEDSGPARDTNIQKSRTFVGICSSNRPEWLVADFACAITNCVSVGIHTSWPIDEVVYVMNNAEIDYIITDWTNFARFPSVAVRCPHLKGIFLMSESSTSSDVSSEENKLRDWKAANQEQLIPHLRIEFITTLTDLGRTPAQQLRQQKWTELVQRKRTEADALSTDTKADTTEDQASIFSLIYSSGTTGVPKGVVSTKGGWRNDNINKPRFLVPDVILSYAALAHGMDRGMCWQTISNGGRVGICSQGEENVIDDAQRLNPVLFVAMPHIWSAIYLQYQQRLDKELQEDADYHRVKNRVLGQFSTILGNRLMQIATGGSATSTQVMTFLKECFKCPVVDAYGTTETPGVATDGIIPSFVSVRLVDVPEMGYTNNDKPYPRGEIWVKTPTMAPGYYRLPEQTAASFQEGFFLTGDIGEIDEEGRLRIIDRKKNILDLYIDGRSVWVAVGQLEAFYLTHASEVIKQIFIHGERTQPCLAAVVVPQIDEYDEKAIWQRMREVAKQEGQPDHHVPGVLIIEREAWTSHNGGLTITNKLARGNLMARYKHAIDLAYASTIPL